MLNTQAPILYTSSGFGANCGTKYQCIAGRTLPPVRFAQGRTSRDASATPPQWPQELRQQTPSASMPGKPLEHLDGGGVSKVCLAFFSFAADARDHNKTCNATHINRIDVRGISLHAQQSPSLELASCAPICS
jgi:hypothetical protein